MTEPRYLPIPFLPAYGVDRDGVVCRLDPYRKVRPIPFHEALRKAARDPFHRSVCAYPERLDIGVWVFPLHDRYRFVEGAYRAIDELLRAPRFRAIPLRGDRRKNWYWLSVPLACRDGRVVVNLLLHGPSVAAVAFPSRD